MRAAAIRRLLSRKIINYNGQIKTLIIQMTGPEFVFNAIVRQVVARPRTSILNISTFPSIAAANEFYSVAWFPRVPLAWNMRTSIPPYLAFHFGGSPMPYSRGKPHPSSSRLLPHRTAIVCSALKPAELHCASPLRSSDLLKSGGLRDSTFEPVRLQKCSRQLPKCRWAGKLLFGYQLYCDYRCIGREI